MSFIRRITFSSVLGLVLFGLASFKLGGCAVEARTKPLPGVAIREYAIPDHATVFLDGFTLGFSRVYLDDHGTAIKDVLIDEFLQMAAKSTGSTAVFVGRDGEISYWLPTSEKSYLRTAVRWGPPWGYNFGVGHISARLEAGKLFVSMFPVRYDSYLLVGFAALVMASIAILVFFMHMKG